MVFIVIVFKKICHEFKNKFLIVKNLEFNTIYIFVVVVVVLGVICFFFAFDEKIWLIFHIKIVIKKYHLNLLRIFSSILKIDKIFAL